MNFIISDLIGARRTAGGAKLFAGATIYDGTEVIVETTIDSSETDYVRKQLNKALCRPLEFSWKVSSIPRTVLNVGELHWDSCKHFDWPIRSKFKYERSKDEDAE